MAKVGGGAVRRRAVRLLLLWMMVMVCTGRSGAGEAAGLSGATGQVVMDLGAAAPGQPVAAPGALQLAVRAETLWQLNLRAEEDFRDNAGRMVPIGRLSWAVAGESGPPVWRPVTLADQPLLAGELPTGAEHRVVPVDLRLDPAWSDASGGPFSTTLLVSLVAGLDLVPSYVWPQPFVPGAGALSIMFYAPAGAGPPAELTVHLQVRDTAQALVAEAFRQVAAGGWAEFMWDGAALNGGLVRPGSYFYEITEDSQLLAHGAINVAAGGGPTPGEVGGTVSAGGEPAVGAGVVLFDDARRVAGAAQVDGAGQFSFNALPLGTYWVEVRLPGYITWISPPFTLTAEAPQKQLAATLTANNALFVTATARILGTGADFSAEGPGQPQAGELVEVTGELRNTGTRLLRFSELAVDWPAGLQPLAADWPAELMPPAAGMGAGQRLALPDLTPGAAVAFRLLAVAGVTEFASAASPWRLRLQATAWAAQDAEGELAQVAAPPRFIEFAVVPGRARGNGWLALHFFWDEDGDGKPDPGEAPAAHVSFLFADGRPAVTDSAGRLSCPVAAGPLELRLAQDDGTWSIVYSGLSLPGGLLEGEVGLRRGQAVRWPGAVVGWTWDGTRLVGEGAGAVPGRWGSWQVEWLPPSQLNGVREQGGWQQGWTIRTGPDHPLLAWYAGIEEKPAPGRRPATLAVETAMTGQPLLQRMRWPAAKSGPYLFPGPVAGVRRVRLIAGRESRELGADMYTWSPSGQLWLASPPIVLWPGRAAGGVGASIEDYLLEADYVPATATGLAQLGAGLRLAVIAAPERSAADDGGINVQETFQLIWKQAPGSAATDPFWQLAWRREQAGATFVWTGGNIPAAAGVPAEGGMVAPARGWIPYLRAEWKKQLAAGQVTISHTRTPENMVEAADFKYTWPGWVQGELQAGVALTRSEWTGALARCELALRLTPPAGGWDWQVTGRWPAAPATWEVSWRGRRPELAGLTLQLAGGMSGRIGWQWRLGRNSGTTATVGGEWQAGRFRPQLAWSWQVSGRGAESGWFTTTLLGGNEPGWEGAWEKGGFSGSWQLSGLGAESDGRGTLVYTGTAEGSFWQSDITAEWNSAESYRALAAHSLWSVTLPNGGRLVGQLQVTARQAASWRLQSLLVTPGFSCQWPVAEAWAWAAGGEWPRLLAGEWQESASSYWLGAERKISGGKAGEPGLWADLQIRWRAGQPGAGLYFVWR